MTGAAIKIVVGVCENLTTNPKTGLLDTSNINFFHLEM